MSTRRAHVVLPEDLVSQIEIRRRHLLEVLKTEESIWRDEDHPELKRWCG